MISGSNALARINTALNKLREQEARCRAAGEARARELIALRNRISEISAELAGLHLSEDGVPALQHFIDQRAATVRELVAGRDDALDNAKARMAAAGNELQRLSAEHAELTGKLQERSNVFEATLQEIEAEGSDPDFFAAQEAVGQLEAKLKRAEARIATAEQDRIEKGRAYESDPLFMYLWNRNYGSAEYNSTGLVRALDKWVARLVRWHDAHPNYRMLNQIPDRLAAHVEQLRADVATADEVLAEAEKRAVARRIGTDPGDEIEAFTGALADCNAKIEAATATLEAAERDADELASGSDERSRQAAELYTQMIESQETRTLWQAAFKTPSPEDDRLVKTLEETRRKVRETEQAQHDAGRELEAIEAKRRELQQVARDFRDSGYDRPGTTFSSDDVMGSMLDGLLTGAVTGGGFWKQIQHTAHRSSNPKGRRRSSSTIFMGEGSWGTPGGFGGGTFGRGGGFGGGRDFDTGGSFGGGGDFDTGGSFGDD